MYQKLPRGYIPKLLGHKQTEYTSFAIFEYKLHKENDLALRIFTPHLHSFAIYKYVGEHTLEINDVDGLGKNTVWLLGRDP
jgi:hypothetical protein